MAKNKPASLYEIGAKALLFSLENPDERERVPTAKDFLDKITAYFEWATTNPLKQEQAWCSQGMILKDDIEKVRAFTFRGFMIHSGIAKASLDRYKQGERGEEFVAVFNFLETCIYEQKFSAAAAGLLNSTIIARDLELAENVNQNNTYKDESGALERLAHIISKHSAAKSD